MLILAITLFILAATLGMYLLSYILRNKETPKGIVFIHGPLATIALIILVIYAFLNNSSPIISIIIFFMTALGGLMMIYRDINGQTVPKWMAIGHGLTAIIGFIFLIIFTFFNTN